MSFQTGLSGLNASAKNLDVIGNNIANANTVGYSRQSATLDAVAGQKIGNAYYGKGVELTSVKRSYDAFLTKQANSTASKSKPCFRWAMAAWARNSTTL